MPRKKLACKKIASADSRSKLDSKRTDLICNAIRVGAYVETAAAHAGISKVTFYKWLRDGKRDFEAGRRTAASAFHDDVSKAMADAELLALKTIHESGQGYQVIKEKYEVVVNDKGKRIERLVSRETSFRRDWQAAGWWCERRFPGKWGRRLEVSGPEGATLAGPVVQVYLPDNQRNDGGNGDRRGNDKGAKSGRSRTGRDVG